MGSVISKLSSNGGCSCSILALRHSLRSEPELREYVIGKGLAAVKLGGWFPNRGKDMDEGIIGCLQA